MITLTIAKSIAGPKLNEVKESLRQAAESVLEYTSSPANAELTILLTTNRRIQQLNRQYRDTDSSTDVLAFPAGETDPESGSLYLGDVVISYPQALSQACAGGHLVDAEMLLLVVHGVLHLCGYDHTDKDSKASMWAAQQEILDRLGSKISPPE
jgi:probable rRNA maturation factor